MRPLSEHKTVGDVVRGLGLPGGTVIVVSSPSTSVLDQQHGTRCLDPLPCTDSPGEPLVARCPAVDVARHTALMSTSYTSSWCREVCFEWPLADAGTR